MTEQTPVTAHVRQCVKLVNEYLQARSRHLVQEGLQEDEDAFEAVFELIDADWDELSEGEEMFREGYETMMLDVVEAIAKEWGVELPQLRVVS